jgi:hypothetical protein
MPFPGSWRPSFRLSLSDGAALVAIFAASLAVGSYYYRHPEIWPIDIWTDLDQPRHWPQGVSEGLLTGLGLLALFLGFRWRSVRWRRTRTALLVLVGLSCHWFAAVDLALHNEWCQKCGRLKSTMSVRVYRCPIWSREYEEPNHFPSRIAADLGRPCPHKPSNRALWIRLWGFIVPHPAMGGPSSLSGGAYEDVRPYVLAIKLENPQLGDEFYRRAIEEEDRAYIRDFMQQIHDRRATAESESWEAP